MRPLAACLLALVLALPARARADLKDYIDDQTVAAGEADLTRIDPPALEQWLRQIAAALDVVGPRVGQSTPQQLDSSLAEVKRWIGEFTQSGGKRIYIVTTGELMKDAAVAIIAPADNPASATALAGLLFSGKATGPASRPNMTRENTGQLYPTWAEVIRNGKAAVHGTGNARDYAKTLVPKDRPDITAALAAIKDSPAKLVLVPNAEMRKRVMLFVPTQDIQWLAIAAEMPPKASLKLIAQGNDPAAAQHAADMLAATLTSIPPSAKLTPQFVKLVTPAVVNDQVALTLDNDKLLALARELKPAMAEARLQAQRVASMSNMRQITMSLQMYRSEHKGQWPDDLKAVEPYLRGAVAKVMTNPANPEVSPAYIYVKPPPQPAKPGEQLVLYESHKDFGEGVNVAFVDGHVEFVRDKKRFDELLAATAEPQL